MFACVCVCAYVYVLAWHLLRNLYPLTVPYFCGPSWYTGNQMCGHLTVVFTMSHKLETNEKFYLWSFDVVKYFIYLSPSLSPFLSLVVYQDIILKKDLKTTCFFAWFEIRCITAWHKSVCEKLSTSHCLCRVLLRLYQVLVWTLCHCNFRIPCTQCRVNVRLQRMLALQSHIINLHISLHLYPLRQNSSVSVCFTKHRGRKIES